MGILQRVWERLSGSGKEADPGTGLGSVLPDQSLWEQFQRIGGGLTPKQVSEIIRLADCGDMSRLVDLANESRQKDGHLQCVLQSREVSVAGLEWELVYPGETKRKKKSRGGPQRRFIEAQLKNNLAFRKLIAHLTGAIYYGYAVAEIIWRYDGVRLVPADFVCHSARRFGFRQQDGAFVFRETGGSINQGVEFREKWQDKFIVAQPRVTGDVPCREGLVRGLMWLALFRNWAMADWMKLAEMAWKPWRRGIFKKTATDKDRENLKAILGAMTSSGVAIHSDQVEVLLEWAGSGGKSSSSGGQGGSHKELFEVAGREMSKAVLGQTLTTEQGDVGSRALGTVHNDVRKDILRSDALYLAEVITRFLIEPMVRLNFGPNAPVPSLRFITEDIADMGKFAEALERLVGPTIRMRVPAEWARDQMGIPDPEEDDELLGIYVDTSAFESKPENDNPDPDPDESPDEEGDDEESDNEQQKAA